MFSYASRGATSSARKLAYGVMTPVVFRYHELTSPPSGDQRTM